jgi:hypothetical protein
VVDVGTHDDVADDAAVILVDDVAFIVVLDDDVIDDVWDTVLDVVLLLDSEATEDVLSDDAAADEEAT